MRKIGVRVGVVAAALALVGASVAAGAAQVASTPFKTGDYEGTTSQHLPVSLTVDATTVQDFSFTWRAKCADGQVHQNGIDISGGAIRHGRFSLGGVLNTGGHVRVSGKLAGSRASGVLSRWGNSAFDTSCPDRGVHWHAHFVSAGTPPSF